jgi:flagellar basal body L-ring protein FlgH
MSHATRIALLSAIFGVALGCAKSEAQEGTTYLTFQGSLFILDNPTNAACQAKNVNFGDIYTVIYRFSASPSSSNPDAIEVRSDRSNAVAISTQAPNYSLNGASTTVVDYVNKYAFTGTLSPSSTNLTILTGLNAPVSLSAGNIKILGSWNDFLSISGCDIASVHAALVSSPN